MYLANYVLFCVLLRTCTACLYFVCVVVRRDVLSPTMLFAFVAEEMDPPRLVEHFFRLTQRGLHHPALASCAHT